MDSKPHSSGKECCQKLEAENTRLQLGISEAHHRVKNTFQNLISYINILKGGKDSLSAEQINKVVNHIHALASLHDILLEEIKSDGDGKSVKLDKVLNEALASFSGTNKSLSWGEIPEINTSPRRTTTLCLVLNELIEIVTRYSDGKGTKLEVVEIDEHCHQYTVWSNHDSSVNAFTDKEISDELRFTTLLANADLQAVLKIEKQGGILRISFPIKAV